MKRLLLLQLLLLAMLGSGLTVSSAAALRLTGGSLSAFTQSRCTNVAVTVDPIFDDWKQDRASSIRVGGIPPQGCQGGELLVSVYEEKKNSGTATEFHARDVRIQAGDTWIDVISSDDIDVRQVQAVLVTIDGWPISTSPFNSRVSVAVPCKVLNGNSKSCSATGVPRFLREKGSDWVYYEFAYEVSASQDKRKWRLSFDLSDDRFSPGGIPLQIRSDGEVKLAGGCVKLPDLLLEGGSDGRRFSSSVVMSHESRWATYETHQMCD